MMIQGDRMNTLVSCLRLCELARPGAL